jgi:cullin 1
VLRAPNCHRVLIIRIDFKSKKIRVNLNLPIKAEVKAETNDVMKTVDEDRKYVIQATIVRYVVVYVSM